MGKTSKWIRNFLTGGKKVQTKGEYLCNEDPSVSTEIPKTPRVVHPSTPKEKKRWSFRRSASGGKGASSIDIIAITPRSFSQGYQKDQKQPLAITDASETVAKAQVISVRLSSASRRRPSVLQDAAATMIQSVFRSYLARKALIALKGIVKLQALMRGHLVRKQTVTTLRCMQALVNVQARTRAQRIQLAEEAQFHNQRTPYRNSPQTTRFRPTYNMDRHMESNANVRVVEMDYGESRESTRRRNSYSDSNHFETPNQRYSQQYQENLKKDYQYQMAIALSGLTNMSPDCKNFDEYSVSSEQSSPYCYSTVSKQDLTRGPCSSPQPYAESNSNDTQLFPNYMANTKSFKAKARSQSAPKQRVNFLERQPSRRKGLMDGGNGFHAVRMQCSSSRVGSTAQAQELPWSLRFEKPRTSFNDSECGSDNTVLSYCRSLAANEVTTY